jgi:hypothetical protein
MWIGPAPTVCYSARVMNFLDRLAAIGRGRVALKPLPRPDGDEAALTVSPERPARPTELVGIFSRGVYLNPRRVRVEPVRGAR